MATPQRKRVVRVDQVERLEALELDPPPPGRSGGREPIAATGWGQVRQGNFGSWRFTMDAAEFFRDIVKANYNEFTINTDDLRLLWNAVVSMNTVAEYVALDRLGYVGVSRDRLYKEAEKIRVNSPILSDLNFCAVTFKHVRKIKDQKKGGGFSTIATSTGASSEDPTTWRIGSHDPVQVLGQAFAALSAFPELS
jgi:hypothetical protein